jgi:hypothetical protein
MPLSAVNKLGTMPLLLGWVALMLARPAISVLSSVNPVRGALEW